MEQEQKRVFVRRESHALGRAACAADDAGFGAAERTMIVTAQRCLRRIEPSAALVPAAGQARLEYVPAAQSDIRKRFAAVTPAPARIFTLLQPTGTNA